MTSIITMGSERLIMEVPPHIMVRSARKPADFCLGKIIDIPLVLYHVFPDTTSFFANMPVSAVGTHLSHEIINAAQNNVKEQIVVLIQNFGNTALGFSKQLPTTLGPALKRFDLKLEEVVAHSSTDKIIRHKVATEETAE